MKVLNTTARVISAGKARFIPAKPLECDFEELKKTYPDLGDYVANGILKVLTEAEAKKAEEDFEAKTVAMLKDIAAKKGINVKGMKKAEIIEAIKKG